MSDIVIYEDGNVNLELSVEDKTIWLDANDIASIFDVNRPAIVKHIGNIYNSEELSKETTCSILEQVAKDGKRRKKNYYNLDMIISVGYRVNSKKATKFRRWSTNILNKYLIQGYAPNKEKLQHQKLDDLGKTIQLIKQGLESKELSTTEAKGFVEIISSYAKSWALLQGYDDQSLEELVQTKETKFILDYDEAKAANLLYYIIKGHPFNDGNKRIGAYLFVLFLHKNGILYKPNGEQKINDNTLVSVALLVAQSHPDQKEIIIKLVMNMLYESEI